MAKTHITIIFVLYYILGIIAFFQGQIPLFTTVLLILTLFLIFKNIINAKSGVIFAILFAFGVINTDLHINDTDAIYNYAPSTATIKARIVSIPTSNSKFRSKFYAKIQEITPLFEKAQATKAKTIVTIYDSPQKLNTLKIGDTIEVKGKLIKPQPAGNPYQFDYAKYLKNVNTYTLFIAQENSFKTIKTADTPYWKFLQNLNEKRSKIITIHKNYIKSPNIELLGGIVFGDDAVNPPDNLKESFLNSGLLHILAASGMNVTLIFGIWFFIAQKFKIHYKLSILTGILLIIFYTCMTGFGPSIMRATLMLIFILLGKLINRDADTLSLLFFVAGLMLILDPAMINNIGFQLSFVVTFGLLFTCPVIFSKIENKLWNIVASAVLVPVIAQLYAAPIQMYYFNTFALYSVLANIAIIPFLTLVSFAGFISSIIAMIPRVGILFCRLSDFVINPFLTSIVKISDYFSHLPNALTTVIQPSFLQLFVYYSALILITSYFIKKFNKKIFIFILTIILVLFSFSIFSKPNNHTEVIFFNVGNADAILIKSPHNKYILIDTGKQPYKMGSSSQAQQIILKYLNSKGIKNLDTLIITHYDSDHAGGAIPLLKNTNIKNIYVAQKAKETNLSVKIKQAAKDKNISLKTNTNCTILQDKNFLIEDITPIQHGTSDNEGSRITLLTSYGQKILFMADANAFTFKKLPQDKIKNIKIIKLGHHGAKNTVTSDMLQKTSAKQIVISTGYNIYGHPNKNTIETLKTNQSDILRTDHSNCIKAEINKNGTEIYVFNQTRKKFEKHD
ncbi:MAG: DNA internalization-related competence protein ComEC/Rec2 [Candidatus Gastranaerophilales bacterium]|nr:DNA internalization-related competence protein ComEC/Rec2 [Candidatus Gastranaerophilales bacterium]